MKRTHFFSSKVGALAIIIAASLWALDGLFLRPSLYQFDVYVIVFLEHTIAFGIMSLFLFPKFHEIKTVKKAEWYTFGLIALFGGTIGTIAITKAFFEAFAEQGSLATVLLLQKFQPVFAILFAIILLKEKPSKNFYYWTILAFIGSYILTFGLHFPTSILTDATSIAAGLSILAAFSFGIGTVLGKRIVTKVSFYISTYLRFALTVLLTGVLLVVLNKTSLIRTVDTGGIKTLIIIAFTTGALAIFIYYYGLKRVKASSATLYELAFPVVAIIGDWMINGQFMGFIRLGGALILIVAITALVLDRKKYRE